MDDQRKKAFVECVKEIGLQLEREAEKQAGREAMSSMLPWWALFTGALLFFGRK